MARVPHVKAFIDLVAANPPFGADGQVRDAGKANGGSRRARKTA
jgi:hypothetical protein